MSRWNLKFVDPYFRYLWTGGSYLKVNAADFLGKRQLEVTRGTNGYALVVTQPVFVKTIDELKQLVGGGTRPMAAFAGCLRREFQSGLRRLHDAGRIQFAGASRE